MGSWDSNTDAMSQWIVNLELMDENQKYEVLKLQTALYIDSVWTMVGHVVE